MSAVAVAKKDFRDAVRSRALWGLSALFILLSTVVSWAYVEFTDVFATGTSPEASIDGLIFFLSGQVSLFVALAALVVCYKSIAGERELGSLKLLLSLPHSRLDVVVGKILGRGATLALPALVGMVLGLALGGVLLGSFPVVSILLFLVGSLVFVITYASLMVGLSGMTGSTTRAATLAVGFFFLVELLWDVVPFGIVFVLNGFALPQTFPDWVFILNQVPPSSAYTTGLAALVPDAPASALGGSAEIDAVYATPWLGVAMLAFWLVVPAAIGYYRFDRSDL